MKTLSVSNNTFDLIALYSKSRQTEINISKDFYTSKRKLSSKIYKTIVESEFPKDFVELFVNKTKKLRDYINSALFFEKNSNIYSIKVSDPDKLSVSLKNEPTEGIDYIKILQLAKNEIYKSKKVLPNSNDLFEPGTYEFQIESANSRHTVKLTIPASENITNKDILTYLEYTINTLNIDILAKVLETQKRSLNEFDPNSLENYIYIQIATINSGNDYKLYLSDLENKLIEKLELTKKEVSSQDAQYIFNGVVKNASINSATEKNGDLSLEFKKESYNFIAIKISKDTDSFLQNLEKIIEYYNKYIDWTQKHQYLIDYKFNTQLSEILKKYSDNLEAISIKPDKNGKLIPTLFFTKNIDASYPKILQNLFGNNSFFQEIKSLANEIINNPHKFLKSKATLTLYSRYGETTNDIKSYSFKLKI